MFMGESAQPGGLPATAELVGAGVEVEEVAAAVGKRDVGGALTEGECVALEVAGARGEGGLPGGPLLADRSLELGRGPGAGELGDPLADVRLDPSGALPMWNSSHGGMKRAFLYAMYRADQVEPFLVLAADYLRDHPTDDRMRLSYVSRLFDSGRHDMVIATMDPLARDETEGPNAACTSRYACWSVILLARSLNALGRPDEAGEILEAIEGRVDSFRLQRRWTEARTEAQAGVGR